MQWMTLAATKDGKKGNSIEMYYSPLPCLLGLVDERLLGQVIHNLPDALLDAQKVGADGDLGRLGSLVGRRDAGKVLDLAGARLLVEALGVPLLGLGQRHVDKDFDEGQRIVAAGLRRAGVQVPRNLSVGAVGRDEGREGDGGRVGEELGDLCRGCQSSCPFKNMTRGMCPYLGDAADVLVAVLLGEAEVLVQAEAHIVAVEPVRGQSNVQQVLFQGRGDGGLARGREAREPDGEAALSAELVALVAREGRVPGDVAVAVVVVVLVRDRGGVR